MMDTFESNGSKKWDEYMDICEAFLDCGLPNFIEERLDLSSLPKFLSAALGDFGRAWPLKPHSDVLDAIFASEKMKALASFQDLYVGLEPFANKDLPLGGVIDTTAPAVFGLLSAIELHPTNNKCGVFAPIGGFRAVTNGMESLARDLGVVIKTETTATKVTSEGVYCCETSNTNKIWFEAADFTVINADLPYAKKTLLDNNQQVDEWPTYDWDDSCRFSCGVIAFHWSFTKTLDDLYTHNVFMSVKSRSSAEKSWEVIRGNNRKKGFELDNNSPFNFYVHRASLTDPSAAPKGADSILVLVPSPTLDRLTDVKCMNREEVIQAYKSQFDEEMITYVRQSVLQRLAVIDSLKDIEQYLVHEVVDTPASFADNYNVGAGTPFGLSHGFGQLSITRPGPHSSGIPNVCFCGASSRPGNGVPLVLIGAKLVADKIANTMPSIANDKTVKGQI
ncbi:hypothetical protein FisN_32Hh044 [Fistulifera solaris]|uniref:Amine oxidase domain-containing protein n=1 Tax=Fistulifera solaris TaxID=1519565 RepID=A0A1Z5K3W5_FISSO|nr:hypothetical protein FisN_32Hh044 [Fistulifera solaris]|eukprot:GAX20658.1 hypothetical protein FisN_32Hh044 [Fistulifera solaris]